MATNPLAFELTLDPSETVRAGQEISRRAREASTIHLVGAWLVIPLSMVLFWKGGSFAVELFIALVVVLALWALAGPLIQRWRLGRFYQSTPALSGQQRYVFTDDGVMISSAGAEHLTRWSAFIEAAETPEFFLFYFAKKCAYYLPKRAVGSDALIDQIRATLHDRLGARAAHVARPT